MTATMRSLQSGTDATPTPGNADYSPDYLARVRSPDAGYLSLPFDGDVELSVKLG
ncbi:hypothetical protein [Novacetimonas pomaceti]|uniref:hypothetical protein n=1 Tax=Novacetimonas pomaceti TaxID=2021998 RepID=UPI001EF0D389|nr:hypothetical protein [Novacetimonas pomaceti]